MFCVLFICVLIYLAFDLISVLVSGWEGNSSLGRLSQFIYKCMQITIIQKSSLLPILEAHQCDNDTYMYNHVHELCMYVCNTSLLAHVNSESALM